MKDTDRFAQMLGISAPWRVSHIEVDDPALTLTITVRHDGGEVHCPRCSSTAIGYDHRVRRLRHLDSMQYRTIVEVHVPRVRCAEHGVLMIDVPWAEADSRFTAAFESLVVAWSREASMTAVAEQLRISWSTVDRIIERAVARGLDRRGAAVGEHLSVDEVSFRKRHRYMTVISDQSTGHVLCVRDGRTIESLAGYFEQLSDEQRSVIRTVSMDMFPAYIIAVERYFDNARQMICFDKFHVAQYLGRAVDSVRSQEHAVLRSGGDHRLKRTRFLWLYNRTNLPDRERERFAALRDSTLKTARAWAIREAAMNLWHYVSASWAEKAWKRWLSWALRSQLEPVRKAARQIRNNLYGIINAIVHRRTNARAESINGRIQKVKARASGFRSRESFIAAIMFHLGGLDVSPTAGLVTHSK